MQALQCSPERPEPLSDELPESSSNIPGIVSSLPASWRGKGGSTKLRLRWSHWWDGRPIFAKWSFRFRETPRRLLPLRANKLCERSSWIEEIVKYLVGDVDPLQSARVG